MAALPYIQLYVADYLADTMHLSAEEHGAYILLIMNYWQTGKPIPGKRIQSIARLSNERSTDVKEVLKEFFTVDEQGLWHHKRIEQELAKVREKSLKASEAGKASAKKRAESSKNKANVERPVNERLFSVEQKINHTDTDTDTDIKTICAKAQVNEHKDLLYERFETFWDAYPKKKNKGNAEKVWLKIKPNEQLTEAIIASIELSKKSVDWLKDNGQFIPYPSTWLNAKGWEDEVSQNSSLSQTKFQGDYSPAMRRVI